MLKQLHARIPVIIGILLICMSVFVGEQLRIYYAIPYFDKMLHLLGGVAVAWFALAFIQKDIAPIATWKQLVIVVSISTFIGVVWEWAEYASNFSKESFPLWYHYFHGGNVADTLGDLAADILGAALFTGMALFKARR